MRCFRKSVPCSIYLEYLNVSFSAKVELEEVKSSQYARDCVIHHRVTAAKFPFPDFCRAVSEDAIKFQRDTDGRTTVRKVNSAHVTVGNGILYYTAGKAKKD